MTIYFFGGPGFMRLEARFVAARDDLGILKSVIGHLKSAIGKTGGLELPDARCQMPVFKISKLDTLRLRPPCRSKKLPG